MTGSWSRDFEKGQRTRGIRKAKEMTLLETLKMDLLLQFLAWDWYTEY
jgi:hypothetical protein